MRRLQAPALIRLFALAALMLLAPRPAHAEETFINAPGRVDMVYDVNRDVAYVAYKHSTGSGVLRYHVGTNTSLSTIPIQGDLMGIDISPDGSLLAVADRSWSAASVWIRLVDLNTLSVQKVEFPRAFYESGSHAVAFANDGGLLFTTGFQGSGWVPMRRYYPATGAWTQLTQVSQWTMVSASADGNTIAFAEPNNSGGPLGRYNVLDGSLQRLPDYAAGKGGTGWFNYEIGASRDATQFAVPTYNGAYIFDAALNIINRVGVYASNQPIGVAYHPSVRNGGQRRAGRAARQPPPGRQPPDGAHPGGHARHLLGQRSRAGWDVSYELVSPPANGALEGVLPNVTYTSNGNFSGRDSFSSRVWGVNAASEPGIVTLDVAPVNDAPAAADAAVTAEDTAATIDVLANDSDLDGDPLAITGVRQGARGTVAVTNGRVTYTPQPDFNGSDAFTYRISDGQGHSATAAVAVTVTPVNDAPVAAPDAAATAKGTAVTIAVLANDTDVDGDPLRVASASGAANGTVAVNANGTVRYTPKKGFTGTDRLNYTASDGKGGTAAATGTITVGASKPPR